MFGSSSRLQLLALVSVIAQVASIEGLEDVFGTARPIRGRGRTFDNGYTPPPEAPRIARVPREPDPASDKQLAAEAKRARKAALRLKGIKNV